MARPMPLKVNTRPTKDQWCKQATWLMTYIQTLPTIPSAHGLKWTTKMIRHYARRYNEWQELAPKSCTIMAREVRCRIQEIVDWAEQQDVK